jgi:hypothetical protein
VVLEQGRDEQGGDHKKQYPDQDDPKSHHSAAPD